MVEVEKLFDHESKLRPILVRPVRSPACLSACAEWKPEFDSATVDSSFSFGALMGCRATSPSRRSGAKKAFTLPSRTLGGETNQSEFVRYPKAQGPRCFCGSFVCLFVDPDREEQLDVRHRDRTAQRNSSRAASLHLDGSRSSILTNHYSVYCIRDANI